MCSPALYFKVGNKEYLSGQLVNITDIGGQPANRSDPGSTLVCVTTNVSGFILMELW